MDTDRNLLLGVLALQSDLIDSREFIDACILWTSRKQTPLVDLLIDRGSIDENDKIHLEYFLDRRLKKHRGDAKPSLAALPDEIVRSLAALQDPDIHQSLAGLPRAKSGVEETLIHPAQTDERYQLTHLHATGGIGRVWLAHDQNLNRDIALKDLRPEHASSAQLRVRFLQEARITGQLEHPGIVPVYELAQRSGGGEPFYTMRFVNGRTLAEAAAEFHESRDTGQVTVSDLLSLLNAFLKVCETIAYAHSQGIVHRDLKGHNVVLGDFGEVVVLDWGLAKEITALGSDLQQSDSCDHVDSTDPGLTIQGQAIGTPGYMSPEQAAGRLDEINHLTDVYGLGAILYEVLTGIAPYTGSDTQEVLYRIQHEELIRPKHIWPDVPEHIESACMRALAKEPCQRFSSAKDLARAVELWQEIEKEQAQIALAASEAMYHSLVETIPMNVWRKDAEGRFTFANRGFCQATGRTLEELLGKTDFDIFPYESARKYRTDDTHVMTSGETIEFLEEHQTADGGKLFVQVVKLPIRKADGTVVGTQGIFWDVTDRKILEEKLADTKEELVQIRRKLSEARK